MIILRAESGLSHNLEELHPAAYVDRFGSMHLPVEVAEKLAHAYASTEPEIVLMCIEGQENEFKARGYEPSERFWHEELRTSMPGFALARYWAGHEDEIATLRSEIERLRKLVGTAADALAKAAAERGGWSIRQAMDGR